ncbi:unnamed protein product [Prorocentrum cordatum]|uniref:Uncharacterized protein n=1 Tax=Prorocentrum cordatum TaxID=2364126 RepID=A0ABN9TAH9_9DINO|nr:unnamed protein product [Polarella glacialis]
MDGLPARMPPEREAGTPSAAAPGPPAAGEECVGGDLGARPLAAAAARPGGRGRRVAEPGGGDALRLTPGTGSVGPPSADAAPATCPGGFPSEVYEMWCEWLDIPEESFPLAQVCRLLARGGEVFRSFVQFLARTSEPHRRGGDADDQEALRRSCVAMQALCHSLAGPNVGTGPQGPRVLGFVVYELLAGLQPGCPASSVHICTALQHLLCAHEAEVLAVLLRCHAPFALVRALDRPGCPDLLMALLAGCEPRLLALVPGRALRPLSPASLDQVLQYLRATGFSGLLAALLDQGARLGGARCGSGSGGSARALGESPPPRGGAGSPVVLTPSRGSGRKSPGTPGRPSPGLGGARWPSTPGSVGAWTPQRPPAAAGRGEASPLRSLALPSGSPAREEEAPCFLGLPVEPRVRRRAATPEPGGAALGIGAEPSPPGRRHECAASPSGGGRAPSPREPAPHGTPGGDSASSTDGAEAAGEERGVGVLLEFLSALTECCGSAPEMPRRARRQQRQQAEQPPPQPQGQDGLGEEEQEAAGQRAGARWRLVEMLVVDTALVGHLFRLLRCEASRFESASLLNALLRLAAVAPGPGLGGGPSRALVEALLGQYLARVDALGGLLLRGRGSSAVASVAGQQGRRRRRARRELRLNAYTVREPLGALRVVLVQILAALADLSPERALPAIKPGVWGAIVHWFLAYRCNHIFQAVGSRLLIAVINHGSPRLQQHVLVKLCLIGRVCDLVLAEGSCGDRWQEVHAERREGACARADGSQVAVRKGRHPGGLGAMVPVVSALAARAAASGDQSVAKELGDQIIAKDAPALACRREAPGSENEAPLKAAPAHPRPGGRRPLAERQALHPEPPVAPPERRRPGSRLALAERQAHPPDGPCPFSRAGPGEPVKALPAAVQGCAPPAAVAPCLVSRLLAAAPLWPQVLGSLGIAPGSGGALVAPPFPLVGRPLGAAANS